MLIIYASQNIYLSNQPQNTNGFHRNMKNQPWLVSGRE